MKAAIYARYSTDYQSESSIADQFRVCTDWCHQNGIKAILRFEDQGISGAAVGNRPGLKQALAAQVDVLIVMDLTRLSRNQGDLPKIIERLTHRGIRVVGVQDGFDSLRKGYKLQAGLTGIMGEAFREMVADKTYSALQSRAQKGQPTGGKAYGYGDGEAAVVNRIFELFADGYSPRRIAEILNREGVPSPGSTWKREARRRGGWHPSAIAGSERRGIGILNNELYVGRDIWNRTKWVKDPDSGQRRAIQRPRSEWIIQESPDKRLISDELWNRVKARQSRRTRDVGEKIQSGMKKSLGRSPRYLFSSILKCKVCGSNYVLADATHYSCSGYVNGKVCANDQRFRRDVMESRLLKGIKNGLLSQDCIQRFETKLSAALRKVKGDPARRTQLEAEIANYADTIAQGYRSKTLLERLQAAESELEQLNAASRGIDADGVIAALPAALARYRTMVEDLGNAPIDIATGREVIRGLVDSIPVRPGPNGIPIAELGLCEEMPLAAVAGGVSHIGLVAGVGFEPTTFGL